MRIAIGVRLLWYVFNLSLDVVAEREDRGRVSRAKIMFDFSHQITSNQLLVAGVGTTVAAYAAMQARALVSAVKDFVRGQLVSTLTARSNCSYVPRLTQLVAKHRLHASGASYSLDEDGGLTIGYGAGVVRWRGLWVWYNLWIDTNNKSYNHTEVLDLTFLTRDRRMVDRFLQDALEEGRGARDFIYVHHRSGEAWRAVSRKKRALASVFANAGMKAEIVAKVAWFLDNEAWYLRRGLNYKLVILLHGQPGTGKSSLIRAIASHFNRDVFCVDSLLDVAPNIGRFAQGILAIEDIDTLGALNRETPKAEDTPSAASSMDEFGLALNGTRTLLHGLLNTLDGLGTPQGLVTIVTTNHVEALDPAMVRPCRIDLKLEVRALDYAAFCEMFASYFDGAAPAVAPEAYAPQTGARLQELLMGVVDAAAASAAVRQLGAGVMDRV